jgi:pimeloyl-ACP methyl ester carboxylesterase
MWMFNVLPRFAGRVLLPLAALVFFTGMAMADDPVSQYVRRSPADATVIVFVHGVMGDGLSSWTNGTTYWPALLTTDSTFDGADIFVYSYPTSFWATLTIDELAENMRATLVSNGVTNYRKIVFLSHSMGGLITRVFLLKNRSIAENTLLAYFLSTPTTGSQLASIARYATTNPQIYQLRTMNAEDYLADLVRGWLSAGFHFPSYCAYEKRPTKGITLVVGMESASALCTKALDPIDADHNDIAKPASQRSASYIAFKAAYADMRILDSRPLSNLTNAQLRERTITIAQGLMQLQDEYHTMQTQALLASFQKMRTLTNEADRRADCQARSEQQIALGNQMGTEFRNRFRTEVIILREELRARLKVLPSPKTQPFPGGPMVTPDQQIFDKPFLTGPGPLSGGADLIEYWAKQLP